jgi:hypothetical protein
MRFFFNLAGAVYDPDNEGTELASMADARIEAVKFAGQFLKDQPEVVWLGDELRVEVTDSNQLILFTVIVFGVDAAAAKGL